MFMTLLNKKSMCPVVLGDSHSIGIGRFRDVPACFDRNQSGHRGNFAQEVGRNPIPETRWGIEKPTEMVSEDNRTHWYYTTTEYIYF